MEPVSPAVLVVDSHVPRQNDRKHLAVVAGVLFNADGKFLLTTRPVGKAYEGYWEFPGGKIENGESREQALARELSEEIGVIPKNYQFWDSLVVDYPHALVTLQLFKVWGWEGCLEMRECQSLSWESHPVQCVPILPGTVPILSWLSEHLTDTNVRNEKKTATSL